MDVDQVSGPATTAPTRRPAFAPPPRRAPTGPTPALLVSFVVAAFLGSALLFLVEPMVAKMLLPRLGGSADVWNTAMVFFQATLLAGYVLAHLSLTRLSHTRQSQLQVAVMALVVVTLPVAVPMGWHPPTDHSPALWTLMVLAVMVGAPFLMLSTISPTLQRWFADTSHPHAADPYFLYAAGNAGSLLGLLAYPLLIEPWLGVDTQSTVWAFGYGALVMLCGACAVLRRRHLATSVDASLDAPTLATATPLDAPTAATATPPIPWRTRGRWIFFAAVPSALMLGVTNHIASDVASMPLLWVIPLSLYLLSFIIAFGRDPTTPVTIAGRTVKVLVVPLALSFLGLISAIWFSLPLHLTLFFAVAMVAHGRLSGERPPPDRLTEFYVLLSVGGVVGGILTALVAPLVFRSVLEYPIAIVAALAILPRRCFGSSHEDDDDHHDRAELYHWPPQPRTVLLGAAAAILAVTSVIVRSPGTQTALTLSILVAAVVAAGAYVVARTPLGFAAAIGVVLLVALAVPPNPTIYQARTFFGVHRVYADKAADDRHVLLNGQTVHGIENVVGPAAGRPETYYHPTGPIGQWFSALDRDPQALDVGIIGLGSGALAWYGRPRDRFTYYEIDPEVVHIATDPSLFTFVPDSKATVDFRLGDGRRQLEESDATYDVLVADAFSSDAIPLHLMTNEALQLYVSHLDEHGVLAFHISNRYFDFAPILGRLAAEQGLTGVIQSDQPTDEQAAEGKFASTWVLLARSPADLAPIAGDPRWDALGDGGDAPLWTDQYTDLLRVLHIQ